MKTIFRFSFLALFTLVLSSVAHANWYNHPICTTGGVILSWHSTYTDFNGSDFKSPDAPGGGVPAANLRGIYERGTSISSGSSGDVKGGSFAVYNGPSRSSIRGWINVTVTFFHNTSNVKTYTFTYTSNPSPGPQYPGAKSW
jgi:hypothetical protein